MQRRKTKDRKENREQGWGMRCGITHFSLHCAAWAAIQGNHSHSQDTLSLKMYSDRVLKGLQ